VDRPSLDDALKGPGRSARFAIGRIHSEAEVNTIVSAFGDDVAALRRYLVDEGFLDRRDGQYWRPGGTVDSY
jgi:hypothetical protein